MMAEVTCCVLGHGPVPGVGEPLNETSGITSYPDPVRLGRGMPLTGTHRLVNQCHRRPWDDWLFAGAGACDARDGGGASLSEADLRTVECGVCTLERGWTGSLARRSEATEHRSTVAEYARRPGL